MKKLSDTTPVENEEKQEKSSESVSDQKKDPTRYGDWEKNGRCIDF